MNFCASYADAKESSYHNVSPEQIDQLVDNIGAALHMILDNIEQNVPNLDSVVYEISCL